MSHTPSTDVLTSRQLAFIAERLPEPPQASTLKGFRRLRYRVDRTAASFHAFVYLAILILCVRRVVSPSRARAPAR